MSFLVAILIVLLLCGIVLVVGAPLRAARRSARAEPAASMSLRERQRAERAPLLERHELEAARAAKYREIRDADLDFRTGKLSREDYEAIDGELRAEAVDLLNRLERLDGSANEGEPAPGAQEPRSAGTAEE